MKWEIVDNSPKVGDVRFITRFAWLPTRVLSRITMTDHMIWLQLYLEEQQYVADINYGDISKYWKTVAKTIHT